MWKMIWSKRSWPLDLLYNKRIKRQWLVFLVWFGFVLNYAAVATRSSLMVKQSVNIQLVDFLIMQTQTQNWPGIHVRRGSTCECVKVRWPCAWGKCPDSRFCQRHKTKDTTLCAEAQTAAFFPPELYGSSLRLDVPHRPLWRHNPGLAHIKHRGCVRRWQPCTLDPDNQSKLPRGCLNVWGNQWY